MPDRCTPQLAITPRRLLNGAIFGAGCALLACGTAAVALHAIPSLQLVHRYTAMAAAFIPYGLPAFVGAAALFASSSGRWAKPVAVAAVAGVILQAWWAKPYWPRPASGSGSITLLTMNTRCDSRGLGDLAAVTERVRPDVAIVQGLTWRKLDLLGDSWHEQFPHSTSHLMPHLPTCGTFVFSRTPLRTLSQVGDVQLVVEVERPDGPFVLLPVDLPTPSKGIEPWLQAFRNLGDAATAHRDRPLVVAGDFNAVREHEPMRRLLTDTGLRDAAEAAGTGWTPTFPSGPWPPLIGLDHVLFTADFHAADVRTEMVRQQQHRALVAHIGRTEGR